MRISVPVSTPAIWIAAFMIALMGACGVFASEEISQAEGLDCVVCHTEPASEVLTDRGKFYELTGSLDGYEDIAAAFEECTACHVSYPGSKELTVRGEMFAFVVSDMEGLLAWVKSEHPGWPDGQEAEVSSPEADSGGEAAPEGGS